MKYILLVGGVFTFIGSVYAQDSIIEKDRVAFIQCPLDSNINKDTFPTSKIYHINCDSMTMINVPIKKDAKVIVEYNKANALKEILDYIFPIITLILGIFVEKFIESISCKKRIEKNAKRWRAELLSLKDPILNQVQSLNQFISDYGENVFDIPPSFYIWNDLKGDNLKSLDKSDLLEYLESYYKEQNPVKLYHQVTGIISILDNQNKNLLDKFKDFLKSSTDLTNSFNYGLQEFNDNLLQLHILQQDVDKKIFTENEWDNIMSLYEKHIVPHLKDSHFNPFILKEQFFLPIIQIMSFHHSESSILPIGASIRKCMNAIQGLHLEKEYICNNLSRIEKGYLELLDTIESVADKINNKNDKG